jgi:GNAT acetyltransferase-like protein
MARTTTQDVRSATVQAAGRAKGAKTHDFMDLIWIAGNQEQELEQWDEFLMKSPRGHYCQFSTWLASFQSYGFDYQVLVARKYRGGPIIGGMGCISVGALGFRVFTSPVGPLVDLGQEELAPILFAEAVARAKESGSAIFEYLLPTSEHFPEFLLPLGSLAHPDQSARGWPIPMGQAPAQMLWVDYGRVSNHPDWDTAMLSSFDAATRRNIRTSLKTRLVARDASTQDELRGAWSLIEQNGVTQGYATRRWSEFGHVLERQVRGKQAAVIAAWLDDRLVGAVYGMLAGQRFSYIMGGTLRLEDDLKVGHFTHWHAMKKAKHLNLRGYDFTSGGPPGVMRFKLGFNPQHVVFPGPQHLNLRGIQANVLKRCVRIAVKHKRQFSGIASTLSKVVGRK